MENPDELVSRIKRLWTNLLIGTAMFSAVTLTSCKSNDSKIRPEYAERITIQGIEMKREGNSYSPVDGITRLLPDEYIIKGISFKKGNNGIYHTGVSYDTNLGDLPEKINIQNVNFLRQGRSYHPHLDLPKSFMFADTKFILEGEKYRPQTYSDNR